jgi:hypothetical protein
MKANLQKQPAPEAGISGDVTGISGDVNACELSWDERAKGVDIQRLVSKEKASGDMIVDNAVTT